MAGKYYHQIHNVKAHVVTLYVVVGILTILLVLTIIGWNNAPNQIRVFIPPDLSETSEIQIGEVPKPTIYTFAHYHFQQLNAWYKDGREDYAQNIFASRAFMTPKFQREIQKDFYSRGSAGELSGRTRNVEEIKGRSYATERVKRVGKGRWIVYLDYAVHESLNDITVKKSFVRYALYVVKYNIDPKRNPWGLAIDGFAEQPRRLSEDTIEG